MYIYKYIYTHTYICIALIFFFFFLCYKNQSMIVHLMHLKVVNSTNINDPLTIFESQQFQNRQTDSKKQQQVKMDAFSNTWMCFTMRWKMAILHE